LSLVIDQPPWRLASKTHRRTRFANRKSYAANSSRGDDEIGAIEARCVHADQDLVRRRHWPGHIADRNASIADNCSFHERYPVSADYLSGILA
jgi:hypothetical protein